MNDATSSNVQLVKDVYAAFSGGNIGAVVDAMSPEIEWHEAEHSPWHVPGGHHGPPAVVTQILARIPETLDNFEVEPLRFHDAGATVIVEARYRADAPATAAALNAQACHVWTIRGGKLAAFQQYTDTWLFAQVTADQPA